MVREEKVLVLAKIWNFLEDRVHEKERQRENRRGSGFDVKAREHESHTHH